MQRETMMDSTTLLELALAPSPAALKTQLEKVVHRLGFDTFAFQAKAPARDLGVIKVAENYVERFLDPAATSRCPVLQLIQRLDEPLIWDGATYAAAGCDDMYEYQSAFGYKTGIATTAQLPDATPVRFGVNGPDRMPRSDAAKADLIGGTKALVVCASVAYFRLAQIDSSVEAVERPLTPREQEALGYVARGLTDQMIASVMKISPSSVRKHVDSAADKLGARNRTQAAVIATQRDLLNRSIATVVR